MLKYFITMIQRIQSIFLFLAFGSALAVFFFPIASLLGEFYYVKLNVLEVTEQYQYDVEWPNTLPLAAVMGITGFLSFVTIFIYKNRLAQMRLIRFGVLLNIVFLALVFFYYVPELEAMIDTTADYVTEPGIYLSILPLVFLVLALRFIRKDEKLIRAADRLR